MLNTVSFAQQIKLNLEDIGQLLKSGFTAELIGQGHKATGSLINSIDYVVKFYQNALVLIVEYNDYGAVVNNGVAANRVPYGKKGAGGKSEYIQGLLNWVLNIKRLADNKKEALGITFAIAKTHAKVGIPTLASVSFSKNGRRVGFQDYVLAQKSDEIIELMERDIELPIWAAFDDFLTKKLIA